MNELKEIREEVKKISKLTDSNFLVGCFSFLSGLLALFTSNNAFTFVAIEFGVMGLNDSCPVELSLMGLICAFISVIMKGI